MIEGKILERRRKKPTWPVYTCSSVRLSHYFTPNVIRKCPAKGNCSVLSVWLQFTSRSAFNFLKKRKSIRYYKQFSGGGPVQMFCLDTNDWLNPQVIQSQYFYFKSSVAALIDSEKKTWKQWFQKMQDTACFVCVLHSIIS